MNIRKRSRRVTVAAVAATALCGGLVAAAVAPAAHAAETRITMPTPTVTHSSPDHAFSNATTFGARVFLGDSTYQVPVGGEVSANFGAVTYKFGTTPQGWRGYWYACSAATQALDTCTIVKREVSAGNLSAANATVTYVVTASDLAKFLVFKGEVYGKDTLRSEDVSQSTTSNRSQDLRVVTQGIPLTDPPTFSIAGVVAGQTLEARTWEWLMTPDLTFTSRTVTAFACPDPNASQVPTGLWNATGCVTVPVTNPTVANSVNAIASQTLNTTAAMGGKYLVVTSNLVAKAQNGLPYVFTVRSAPTLLPPDLAVAPEATPTPTPTPTPEATDPTTPPNGITVAPVQPSMKVLAAKKVQRGKRLLVTVKLTGKGAGTLGTGRATVELVKSQLANAKAVKKLRPILVEDLNGARYETIAKKLKKGPYYLRVVFTDAGSGVQSASLKKLTVR